MGIKELVTDFAARLQELIEAEALEHARDAVLRTLGIAGPRKPGRPPMALATLGSVVKKPRKKPPRQLCPVPGCKNTAAPVFGMVCADHKDVSKTKLKKYREERRAKKLGGGNGVAGAAKRRAKPGRKKSRRKAAARKQAPKARAKSAKKSSPPVSETPAAA